VIGVPELLAAALRISTPIALAAVGETYSERAGVLNVGIEGMMLFGSFAGIVASILSGSALVGLAGGALAGIAVALVHGLISITLKSDQIVSGIGINLVALGLTSYLVNVYYPGQTAAASARIPELSIAFLSDLPLIGPVLFQQNPIVYLTIAIAVASYWVLHRTQLGRSLTACGENPKAADVAGISVERTRYVGVCVAGALAGLGGAVLSIIHLGFFSHNMTGGRGFIALAAVLFGNWKVVKVALASLFFGLIDALQLQLQAVGVGLPPEFLTVLPYVLTVAVLSGAVGTSRMPSHFARPYIRGEPS
jgi:simple sugar transport system permease protein